MSIGLGIIFSFCILGVGYTSYKIGVRNGIERALERLEEINIINIDEYGRISPKPNVDIRFGPK